MAADEMLNNSIDEQEKQVSYDNGYNKIYGYNNGYNKFAILNPLSSPEDK